jgi:hypothetical protein
MASNPIDDVALVRSLRAQNEAFRQENDTLKNLGGGGTSGGMEGRVARLEAHVETLRADVGAIKKDVSDIRIDLATLKERVAHLPGKGFIVTVVGGFAVVLAFADKIMALLGAG